MDFLPRTLDVSKIEALIYHFSDGHKLRLEIKDAEKTLSGIIIVRFNAPGDDR